MRPLGVCHLPNEASNAIRPSALAARCISHPFYAAFVRAFNIDLVPIRRIEGREIDPAAPLDPYFLLDLYGPA